MYTANTMSSAFEAMGLSLPYSSTMSAVDDEKRVSAEASGRALVKLIENDVTTRDIMTRESFENAIRVVMAVGGSTNAGAAPAGRRPRRRDSPHARRLRAAASRHAALRRPQALRPLRGHRPAPRGRHPARHEDVARGRPPARRLPHHLTGRTVAENLQDVPSRPPEGQDVVLPIDRPMYPHGHLAILRGNLAPDGRWRRRAA